MILPNDKGAIWRVLNVKLKKSRTFQAKYFHNTEESIMVAMINKSVLREICRACATRETASLRQLSIDHIVNVLYKRCGLAKTRLRHPSLLFVSLPYPTCTVCRRVRTLGQSRDNQTKRSWPYSMSMGLCPTRASCAWEPRNKHVNYTWFIIAPAGISPRRRNPEEAP